MVAVQESITQALHWTKRSLFTPFDIGKWFVLGFTSFLADFLGGWTGNGYRFSQNPFGGSGAPLSVRAAEAHAWIGTHLPLAVAVAVLSLAVMVGLTALFLWLGARGQFMFLDNVVHLQAAVSEPWHQFRQPANRVFRFTFLLSVASWLLILLIVALGWVIALPDIRAAHLGQAGYTALGACVTLVLLVFAVWLMLALVLKDFVIPIMYLRGVPVAEAYGIFWRDMLPGRFRSVAFFYVSKLVMGFLAWLIMVVGFCLSCCLVALPYVGSVVYLPISVFFRSYSLCFLAKFGPEWRLLGEA